MSTHNRVYTGLLIALAFFTCIGAIEMFFFSYRSTVHPDGGWIFTMIGCIELLFVAAMVTTLILRGVAPQAGRIATLALNIVLLLMVPLGTAVGIYGLWKVDKGDTPPQTSP